MSEAAHIVSPLALLRLEPHGIGKLRKHEGQRKMSPSTAYNRVSGAYLAGVYLDGLGEGTTRGSLGQEKVWEGIQEERRDHSCT